MSTSLLYHGFGMEALPVIRDGSITGLLIAQNELIVKKLA